MYGTCTSSMIVARVVHNSNNIVSYGPFLWVDPISTIVLLKILRFGGSTSILWQRLKGYVHVMYVHVCMYVWPHVVLCMYVLVCTCSYRMYVCMSVGVPTKRLFGPIMFLPLRNRLFFRQKSLPWHRLCLKKILRVVKLNIHLFVVTYSLPESDGHCEHGGIGVTTFFFFFLIVFQRLMP